MKLPSVKELQVAGKTVLLRTDYDVVIKDGRVGDTTRIEESLPTIKYLFGQRAKVIIISHLGRPEGKIVPELSLKPVAKELQELLPEINFQFSIFNFQSISNFQFSMKGNQIILLENLRFYSEEEVNDENFAKKLANLADFYVNEAFAVCHREHASIVGIPKFLPSAFGLDCLQEIETLSKIREHPRRPVVVILGGVKEDKLEHLEKISQWADFVLIGGKLPDFISNIEKVIVAKLNPSGKDITLKSAEEFKKAITKAGTVIWAGPMGVYEEKENGAGTQLIAEAMIGSGADTVVGGGDTEAALTKFGLEKKINFISSGGGAMLEFLAKGTLPGIRAIISK